MSDRKRKRIYVTKKLKAMPAVKIIYDTTNEKWLKEKNPSGNLWTTDVLEAQEFPEAEINEIIEGLEGEPGQFIGQNPPPR